MKKSIIPLAIATIVLAGCTTNRTAIADRYETISWNAFCDARGFDRADKSEATVNEYLDAWCGSADEEAALTAAGVEL